jgi:hypothetical protein
MGFVQEMICVVPEEGSQPPQSLHHAVLNIKWMPESVDTGWLSSPTASAKAAWNEKKPDGMPAS